MSQSWDSKLMPSCSAWDEILYIEHLTPCCCVKVILGQSIKKQRQEYYSKRFKWGTRQWILNKALFEGYLSWQSKLRAWVLRKGKRNKTRRESGKVDWNMPDKLSIIPVEMTHRVTKCTANSWANLLHGDLWQPRVQTRTKFWDKEREVFVCTHGTGSLNWVWPNADHKQRISGSRLVPAP